MKTTGFILLAISVIFGILLGRQALVVNYQWNKQVGNYWQLADRASTLEQKSIMITKFVEALEKSNHSEYNALIYKTPENNFEQNMTALKTLQQRLIEIKTLDPNSFAYQTAIQQITAQEQGQANDMLNVLQGSWTLENYPLMWDWLCGLFIAIEVIIFMGAFFFF